MCTLTKSEKYFWASRWRCWTLLTAMEKRRWSITGCVDTLIHNMDNSKTTEKDGQHGKKKKKNRWGNDNKNIQKEVMIKIKKSHSRLSMAWFGSDSDVFFSSLQLSESTLMPFVHVFYSNKTRWVNSSKETWNEQTTSACACARHFNNNM